jgi:hypothetical protein
MTISSFTKPIFSLYAPAARRRGTGLAALLAAFVSVGACAEDASESLDLADHAALGAPELAQTACSERTATKVPFTSIPGYQRLAKEPTTGPEKALLESNPALPEWTIYRPESLEGEKKPVLIWANGGCLKNGTLYGQWLLELASHGYLAVADGKPQAANADPAAGGIRGFGADGKPMQEVIDWLTAENDRPCSPYYQKLDLSKIAVAGQSCGGMMAMSAAGDKRVTTAIIANSGLFARDQKVYSALHGPLAFLIGGRTDIASGNAEADFNAITTVPMFLGNLDVGHGGTWSQTNAGEMGRVGLAWLNWQLKGDETAAKQFTGADCALCKSPSKWTVKKKKLD